MEEEDGATAVVEDGGAAEAVTTRWATEEPISIVNQVSSLCLEDFDIGRYHSDISCEGDHSLLN